MELTSTPTLSRIATWVAWLSSLATAPRINPSVPLLIFLESLPARSLIARSLSARSLVALSSFVLTPAATTASAGPSAPTPAAANHPPTESHDVQGSPLPNPRNRHQAPRKVRKSKDSGPPRVPGWCAPKTAMVLHQMQQAHHQLQRLVWSLLLLALPSR